MLTADDLTAMQATLDGSLPDSATIKRLTRTSDGAGGYSEAWNAVGAAVACRVSPLGSAAERELATKLSATLPWVLTFPDLTDVTAQDRITVGVRTFQAVGVLAARTWEISRRVLCQEVL